MDVISLTQKLIQFPSITPKEEGCLDFIEDYLTKLGFSCYRLPFDDVDNLYARFGTSAPHFCFAGHVDVVSDIDASKWSYPPFSATIKENILYGRGAVDMKGAVAAFLDAVNQFIKNPFNGSISFLLTTDEEGPAINGTSKVLDWLKNKKELINVCLVGEPTNPHKVGEMIKIGRRGSLNIDITVNGVAGHVAYPELAKNPIPTLLHFLQAITTAPLDEGTEHFSPSHLEVTSIDVGNSTRNIIPALAHAKINIRFNPLQSSAGLVEKLKKIAAQFPLNIDIHSNRGCEAFMSTDPHLTEVVRHAVEEVCGIQPYLSTTGGTSDARFIKDVCPVIEFGLVSATAHHIDEHILVSELVLLRNVYLKILQNYFT